MAEEGEFFPTTTRPPPEPRPRGLAGDADPFGRSYDGFALDAARRPADDVLLDQVFFSLGDRAFAQFQALIESPPVPGEPLARLLRSVPPWG